ncbi:MAG: hypothetical protein JNL34_03510 [Anaerolineae bacterium]|nr:hypothetical protein [Anaerolineae bacterium]
MATLPADGAPPPDQLAELRALSTKMAGHQRVSIILMLVALVCMGSARTF